VLLQMLKSESQTSIFIGVISNEHGIIPMSRAKQVAFILQS